MRVAVTGGTGFIGTALRAALVARGDDVIVLTRSPTADDGVVGWDPARGIAQPRRLDGIDAVVNLTGAPLATRPWTKARRRQLVDSRVEATRQLLASLERVHPAPGVFVGVAALGRFGDRGADWIDDDDPPGEGFLADLSVAWEDAQLAAESVLGARSAVLRMGIVWGASGGAFPHFVAPFRHGFGGWLGDGAQYTPWMSCRDAVRALIHLLDTPTCRGGFNGNVPDPVPHKDFAKAMGRAVDKPVRTHAPRWALRGALGQLADSLLIASVRAKPRKLIASGFDVLDPEPEALFRRLVDEFDQAGGSPSGSRTSSSA